MDNNNGLILLSVDEKGQVTYQVLTGPEDDEGWPRDVTPQEYVKVFHHVESEKEGEAEEDEDMKKVYEFLSTKTRGDVIKLMMKRANEWRPKEVQT